MSDVREALYRIFCVPLGFIMDPETIGNSSGTKTSRPVRVTNLLHFMVDKLNNLFDWQGAEVRDHEGCGFCWGSAILASYDKNLLTGGVVDHSSFKDRSTLDLRSSFLDRMVEGWTRNAIWHSRPPVDLITANVKPMPETWPADAHEMHEWLNLLQVRRALAFGTYLAASLISCTRLVLADTWSA